MRSLLLVLLLLNVAARGEQPCPIQIVNVHGNTVSHELRIQFTNTASKPIKAVAFGHLWIDEFGNQIKSVYPGYKYSHQIESGKSKTGSWSYYSQMERRSVVWLKDVAFENGELWTDDGSMSCKFTNP